MEVDVVEIGKFYSPQQSSVLSENNKAVCKHNVHKTIYAKMKKV